MLKLEKRKKAGAKEKHPQREGKERREDTEPLRSRLWTTLPRSQTFYQFFRRKPGLWKVCLHERSCFVMWVTYCQSSYWTSGASSRLFIKSQSSLRPACCHLTQWEQLPPWHLTVSRDTRSFPSRPWWKRKLLSQEVCLGLGIWMSLLETGLRVLETESPIWSW